MVFNPFSLETQAEGVVIGEWNRINFSGAGVSVSWDAVNGRANITINGAAIYGHMYQGSSGFTVTLTAQNTWYELDAATTNISSGLLNQVTFPGDHYLQVANAGIYKIDWSCTVQINSANQGVSIGIMKNGSIQSEGIGRTYFLNATRNLNVGSTAILSLNANDQISLGARNITSAAKIITVAFINVALIMLKES